MFRNEIGILIVCDSPFETFPILLWMYMGNVSLYHHPIFIMVVLLVLCSFRDKTPPDLRGFQILHVEYLMAVQVVVLMVP